MIWHFIEVVHTAVGTPRANTYSEVCSTTTTEQSNPRESLRKSGFLLLQYFARLIHTLEVHPDAIELMAEPAAQTRFGGAQDIDDLHEQKKDAIAKHKRAINNNFTLFQNGEIDSDEYYRQKDYHECRGRRAGSTVCCRHLPHSPSYRNTR